VYDAHTQPAGTMYISGPTVSTGVVKAASSCASLAICQRPLILKASSVTHGREEAYYTGPTHFKGCSF
jgi:hypothetical protein